jgi:hypothetical protein
MYSNMHGGLLPPHPDDGTNVGRPAIFVISIPVSAHRSFPTSARGTNPANGTSQEETTDEKD